MGNRSSSASKQERDVVNGNGRATVNGTRLDQSNDNSCTRTQADGVADQQPTEPSLNLTMYRSISQTSQVTGIFSLGRLTTAGRPYIIPLCFTLLLHS